MQNQANLSVLETKRELEIRDKDLAIKEKQRQIEELAVAKKRNDRLIYILLIALLLLVVGIVGKRANEYWRLTKNLAMEKSTLATQLEARIAQVKKKKHALDEIAHIQSHDVRGPVATILGLSQLFNLDDPTDPENKAIIKGITQIAEQLDKVITHIVKEKANQDKDEI